MREVPSYLHHHETVVEAFGYWPAFHDAKVKAFALTSDEILLTLHTWEMTSDLDPAGFYILRKHHLIHFLFSGIVEADLEDFYPANTLYELSFSPVVEFARTGLFSCAMDSVMGCEHGGTFTAMHGSITALSPCDHRGRTATE